MHSLLAAFALLAAASGGDSPAIPEWRRAPDYPASCMPAGGETAEPQKVIVTYRVNTQGEVENARVRETTDACFNETAIAAVRTWRFQPARSGGGVVNQEDLETTFTFVFNAETVSEDFDARPIKRDPPDYPQRCYNQARNRETVLIEFDVTISGETANARVIDSTNSCLNSIARASVRKWRYRPKIVGGEPVERKGVQSSIVFDKGSGFSAPPDRVAVGRRLNSIAAKIRAEKDPQEILADLAEVEAKYGDDFTRTELKAFHQIRGAARLSAKDYRGALDDFRVVQKMGLSGESGEAIAKTIENLESYIAAQDAASAAKGTSAAPPAADSPPEKSPEPQ